MQISNSVFLVTGAASGLGAASARMLAAEGGRVALLDLDRVAGTSLAQELVGQALFLKVDVCDPHSTQAAITTVEAELGPLNGAICCAGIAPSEKMLGRDGAHSLASFVRTLNVNVSGTFNILRLAAQAISRSAKNSEGERGVLIATASIAAFDGQIGQAAYAASKAAVAGLTLPVARELARHGIRMMTIAPGIFETPMMAGFSEEARSFLASSVPFPPRLGRPSEFARLVREIIQNPMLNGEMIRLDGALRMSTR